MNELSISLGVLIFFFIFITLSILKLC
ncbi:MAG TPA: hypothetical protein DEO87_01630 [Lachnospiraceae bacterium]|nr:hypothetical protein [Lachnospiraceae bacterium]